MQKKLTLNSIMIYRYNKWRFKYWKARAKDFK